MSKLDIGVGEEFPVDEEKMHEEAGAAPGEDADPRHFGRGHRFGGQHGERREALRAWRNQMRSEWKERKRAMHEQFHREFPHGEFREHAHHRTVGTLAVVGLALIGLAALVGRHHSE